MFRDDDYTSISQRGTIYNPPQFDQNHNVIPAMNPHLSHIHEIGHYRHGIQVDHHEVRKDYQ